MQAKRLQLDGGDRDRSERKRKSRFGDDDAIAEKTLIPMVGILIYSYTKKIMMVIW